MTCIAYRLVSALVNNLFSRQPISYTVCYILLTMEHKFISIVLEPFEKMQMSENRNIRKAGLVLGYFWAMSLTVGTLATIGILVGKYGYTN